MIVCITDLNYVIDCNYERDYLRRSYEAL